MRSRLINSDCLKALLAGSAIAGALAAAGSALAAEPAPANNEPANTVGEVVVTAQFRATQLQKTPLAISAVTGQQIEAMGHTNVTDLARTIPNTVISPLGSGWGSTLAAFIRGVGLGDNILSFEPGVPIMWMMSTTAVPRARSSTCWTSIAWKCCAAPRAPCSARTPSAAPSA